MEIKSRHFQTENGRLSNDDTKGYSSGIKKMSPDKTSEMQEGRKNTESGKYVSKQK